MTRALALLFIAPLLLLAACDDNEEALPNGTDAPTATAIPPRASVSAPWISYGYLPWERGHGFTMADPSCDDPSGDDCRVITAEFDPSAPIGSDQNPCQRAGAAVALAAEMQRRASVRNGSDCVNGWQYEWAGLWATPEPTPPDPWILDDGVIQGMIVDCFSTDPECYSGDRTCLADADVLIKDERVHEVVRKGRLVEIAVGEAISGSEGLPDYDEIYLSHAVHRDEMGMLVAGYRECWEGTSITPP